MPYQIETEETMKRFWENETATNLGVATINKDKNRFLSYFFKNLLLANTVVMLELAVIKPTQTLRRSIAKSIGAINFRAVLKRTIDIIGAIIGLIISLPIWVLVPIAIAIDSRGPIFYRQERVGIDRRRRNRRSHDLFNVERRALSDRRSTVGFGKAFRIIKFRSMHVNAEKETGPVWATKNDSRVTRVGRILRATRLDEIPQLINVLIGDMSLVGPRPERPFFVKDLRDKIHGYSSRFQVKPGITGLAQVEHKYDESIEDVHKKVSYDLNYIRSWSVYQDMRIILKTIVVVFTMRGM